MPSRTRRDRLILGVAAALLLPALGYLATLSPSEVPTVEQLMPPARAAEVRRLRSYFGAESDLVLVSASAAGRPPSDAELLRLEDSIAGAPGVSHVFSAATRPRLALADVGAQLRLERGLPPAGFPTALDHFLRPVPGVALLIVSVAPSGATLSNARHVLDELHARLAGVAATAGLTVRISGFLPQRVATWEEARRDVRRTLPLLILAAVIVPVLFFRSAWAAVFPLIMAGLASAATVLLYRAVVGALHPWVLILLPLVWSVATMDTLHLWECATRLRAAGHPDPVSEAARELALPCLVTALVTAASLLAMATPGGPPLVRMFGVWGAVGTAAAYALSFVVAGPLLRLASMRGRPPEGPSRFARRVIALSQRRVAPTAFLWLCAVVAAAAGMARLGAAESSYTDAFVATHPFARDLAAVRTATGSDLVPLEVYVEATPARRDDARALLLATTTLDGYLRTLPETRLSLSVATLTDELLATDPRARELARAMTDRSEVRRRLAPVEHDRRLAPWIDLEHGATRTLLLLAPTTFARRAELLGWIEHFGRTMLDGFHVGFGGVGYLYHAAELEARGGIAWGLAGDLVLLVLALALGLGRCRAVVAGLLGNVAPVVVLGGVMAAAGVSWSLGLIGLPVIVLGLAADDTIHLLWPMRHTTAPIATSLSRAYRRFGSAALATSVLVAASLAAVGYSDFRASRALGWLLPTGILVALAAELTLVPALLALRRRRGAA